jgi:hypothetical protein
MVAILDMDDPICQDNDVSARHASNQTRNKHIGMVHQLPSLVSCREFASVTNEARTG